LLDRRWQMAIDDCFLINSWRRSSPVFAPLPPARPPCRWLHNAVEPAGALLKSRADASARPPVAPACSWGLSHLCLLGRIAPPPALPTPRLLTAAKAHGGCWQPLRSGAASASPAVCLQQALRPIMVMRPGVKRLAVPALGGRASCCSTAAAARCLSSSSWQEVSLPNPPSSIPCLADRTAEHLRRFAESVSPCGL